MERMTNNTLTKDQIKTKLKKEVRSLAYFKKNIVFNDKNLFNVLKVLFKKFRMFFNLCVIKKYTYAYLL